MFGLLRRGNYGYLFSKLPERTRFSAGGRTSDIERDTFVPNPLRRALPTVMASGCAISFSGGTPACPMPSCTAAMPMWLVYGSRLPPGRQVSG